MHFEGRKSVQGNLHCSNRGPVVFLNAYLFNDWEYEAARDISLNRCLKLSYDFGMTQFGYVFWEICHVKLNPAAMKSY